MKVNNERDISVPATTRRLSTGSITINHHQFLDGFETKTNDSNCCFVAKIGCRRRGIDFTKDSSMSNYTMKSKEDYQQNRKDHLDKMELDCQENRKDHFDKVELLEMEIVRLKLELAQCRGQIDEDHLMSHRISNERDHLHQELNDTTTERNFLRSRNVKLESENAELRTDYEKLIKVESQLKRENWEFEQKLSTVNTDMKEHQSKLEGQEIVMNHLKNTVEVTLREKEELVFRNQRLGSDCDNLAKNAKVAATTNEKLETEKTELETKLKKIEHKEDILLSDIECFKEKIKCISLKCRNLAEENDQLKTEVDLLGSPVARRSISGQIFNQSKRFNPANSSRFSSSLSVRRMGGAF